MVGHEDRYPAVQELVFSGAGTHPISHPLRHMRSLLALLVVLVAVPSAHAQDVEMLGLHYGTPVPEGYYRTRAADADAYQFARGWARRGADVRLLRGALLRSGPQPLGPRSGPVVGSFEVPVLLGLYDNAPTSAPHDSAIVAEAYFGPGEGTITDYYHEVSDSLVTLRGVVFDWVRAPGADSTYTEGDSGLTGGAGDFVKDLLALQPATDWGRYDNDGPDGVPNSGDDDGFVDVLAAIHPTSGGECGGSGSDDRIWSHRWSLSSATGSVFVTDTESANGGFIRIDDYTIQPGLACSGGALAPIGIFTHELGHAFGLPDLYDTNSANGSTSGAGTWDLMSSGSWGCNNAAPQQPCHMGAWSKAALGWVDVVTLAPDTDFDTLSLGPVEETGQVYRIDAADGSGEYFLLENRQRLGYDANLYAEGLLIWHVSTQILATQWPQNRVNAGNPMGVWLRQADGRGDLDGGSGRGDGGDPFPGTTARADFHVSSTPSSRTHAGAISGLTIYDIETSGDDVVFGLTTRSSTLTVRAEGTAGSIGLFTVDGEQVDPPQTTFASAPFLAHRIEAAAGESTGPGTRTPFTTWSDDPAADRVRTVVVPLEDAEYVANYAGSQVQLAMTSTGGVNGVEPATFSSSPISEDLWYDEGAEVTVQALPKTGFSFLEWTGALAGQPNPATVTMNGPVEAGADFELIYAPVDAVLSLPAATPLDVQLEVANGTAPIQWAVTDGALPTGVELSSEGRLTGSALELGDYVLTVEAVDGLGLPGAADITLEMARPSLPIEGLASAFLLSGPALTEAQSTFLDLQGNEGGSYDIGDFRAWLLSDPGLPLSAMIGAEPYRTTVVIPVAPGPEGRR